MVAVGCETEPVSKNDEFLAYAKKVLDAVDASGVGAEAELEEERVELSAKLGENIVVAGAARFEAVDGGLVAAYAHPPANKLGVLAPDARRRRRARRARSRCTSPRANPQWIAREDVPADVVAAEREIYANSDEVQSKPEQAREKIVDGMLNKRFFGANVLVDQEWIHDSVEDRRARRSTRPARRCSSSSASRSRAERRSTTRGRGDARAPEAGAPASGASS